MPARSSTIATVFRIGFSWAVFTIFALQYPTVSYAADKCSSLNISVSGDFSGPYYVDHPDNQITLTINGPIADGNYSLGFENPLKAGSIDIPAQASAGKINFSSSDPEIFNVSGPWSLYLTSEAENWTCTFSEGIDPMFDPLYTVEDGVHCKSITISQVRNQDVNGDGIDDVCFGGTNQGCLESSADVTIDANLEDVNLPYANKPIIFRINREGSGNPPDELMDTDTNGNITKTLDLDAGTFTVKIKKDLLFIEPEICSHTFTINSSCAGQQNSCTLTPIPVNPGNNGGGNPPNPGPGAQPGAPDTFSFCSQINDANLRSECTACAEGDKGYAGVWTAIGCIKRDPEAIVRKFMIVGLSMGGGVALLTFLAAGFMLSTSQGNTQQTDQAKQMLTASITGLLFIIFSVTILEYIGYSILGIPGFGG